MNFNSQYVWYASYGSNLNKDRFMCYIKGGKPNDSSKAEKGCSDKSPPIKNNIYIIDRPLYFAKRVWHWNYGGVCFIGNNKNINNFTISRKYLITKEQFIDIVKQENSIDHIHLDFNKIIELGAFELIKKWYGQIVFLGYNDNYPIFTFTTSKKINEVEFIKPDKSYLKTIITGLKQFLNENDEYITNYLINKPGIKKHYSKKELLKLIEDL